MRARDDRDQRDVMLAQMVDAFMAGDVVRFREACAWLRDYCDDIKRKSGRVLVGRHWFDPERRAALVRNWHEQHPVGRRGRKKRLSA